MRAQLSLLAGILLLTACSDTPSPTGAPTEDLTLNLSQASALRAVAADQLTKAVALALRDRGLREQIKNHLRASRHTPEHKLEFSSYLRASGDMLLAQMGQGTGKSRDALLSLVNTAGPLEFYMPVREHRQKWSGGEDLLVAFLLNEESAPIAYTLQGTRLTLSTTSPPATPVLVLVPVETDFSRPLAGEWRNSGDQRSGGIGTWEAGHASLSDESSCDPQTAIVPCEGSSGGGVNWTIPPTAPSGLYMTSLELSDLGESWAKGDPEIEVLILGPDPGDSPDVARVVSCAGGSDYRPGA